MYIRRAIAILLAAALLLSTQVVAAQAQSDIGIIYEKSTKEIITSGAVLENIQRFTDDGWLNIKVLRTDLTNPNIKVDAITNPQSIRKLTQVKSLAESKGAVAAINGSFFIWSDEQGKADTIGPLVESGSMLSASADFNVVKDNMATFSIDNLNNAMFNYWKTEISLVAPNSNTIAIGRYNKPYYGYSDFTIMDGRYRDMSVGVTAVYTDLIEMVVDNGVVMDIRQSQPAVPIPKNGFVVITRKAGAEFLFSNFIIGDKVALSIKNTPDISSLKMAVSGGAILVSEGNIPGKFTHDAKGRNPRTAVGCTRDGKQLIMVTVDGRRLSSIGMTQTELAQYMISLGAYNAINLDGGGSTAMVAREPGTTELSQVNNPSDSVSRGVTTAIGVISEAPKGELAGLLIDSADKNVFLNTSREYVVKGVDQNNNPVEVKPQDVKWSVNGINGVFKDGIFYPKTIGDGSIIARVGKVTGRYAISVLSAPVRLELDKKTAALGVGQSAEFTAKGWNKNGYDAYINPADIKWSVSGNMGKFNKNVFSAEKVGVGYVAAAVGKVQAYGAVTVTADVTTVKDNFENPDGSFTSSPAGLPGVYEISTEQKQSGSSSGKLTYDFSSVEGTRAAYLVFGQNGVALGSSPSKIGVWVYNTHENSNWVRAEVVDKKGGKHLVEFAKGMDWTGWKYLEASIIDIDSPAAISRLYLVQPSPVADIGFVYFDDLTVTESPKQIIDPDKIPKDTVPVDEANKAVKFKKSPDSYRFAVFGQSTEPKSDLEKKLTKSMMDKINLLDAAALVGASEHADAKTVKKPYLATYKGYKSMDLGDSRLIQLDTRSGGLRTTAPSQWHWLMDQLETAKGSSVFIFMPGSPKNFNDRMESKLFQDVLTEYRQRTGKTVWVFYNGENNSSYMERGIKYISTTGYGIKDLSAKNANLAKYILVTVKGKAVTYEFKPI